MADLSKIGLAAAKKEDKAASLDCMIRIQEHKWLLSQLRKR